MSHVVALVGPSFLGALRGFSWAVVAIPIIVESSFTPIRSIALLPCERADPDSPAKTEP